LSKLIEELVYIFEWLEYSIPDLSDRYKPGLTRQKIDTIVKDLPFKLSEEVYELYQWRNGEADLGYNNGDCIADFLFPDHHLHGSLSIPFSALQDSCSNYQNLWHLEQESMLDKPHDDFKLWDKMWFPLASMENKTMLCVIGNLDPSPVYQIELAGFKTPLRIYKNLTSMLSVIAECCESDLYKIFPDEYEETYFHIKLDEEKHDLEKAIYQKYNS
jgi:cell wall assembly regulator SMI1